VSQATDVRWRMFYLGSYLLIKASHTYLNIDWGMDPERFPEYGLDLGSAVTPLPASIGALKMPGGAYVRRYQKGLVAVNPGQVNVSRTLPTGTWRLTGPVGGGIVPVNGNVSAWRLNTAPAPAKISLPPRSAVVVLGN
jgi:hypothetical protein